jgi:hypothetical protein
MIDEPPPFFYRLWLTLSGLIILLFGLAVLVFVTHAPFRLDEAAEAFGGVIALAIFGSIAITIMSGVYYLITGDNAIKRFRNLDQDSEPVSKKIFRRFSSRSTKADVEKATQRTIAKTVYGRNLLEKSKR